MLLSGVVSIWYTDCFLSLYPEPSALFPAPKGSGWQLQTQRMGSAWLLARCSAEHYSLTKSSNLFPLKTLCC